MNEVEETRQLIELARRISRVEQQMVDVVKDMAECRQDEMQRVSSLTSALRVWTGVFGLLLVLFVGVSVYQIRRQDAHEEWSYHKGTYELVDANRQYYEREMQVIRDRYSGTSTDVATIKVQLASLSIQVERVNDKVDKLLALRTMK